MAEYHTQACCPCCDGGGRDCLAESYAFGKQSAYAEINAVLDAADHPAGCRCAPCLIICAVRQRYEELDASLGYHRPS